MTSVLSQNITSSQYLISSMHDRKYTDQVTNKPEIITFYNENKGGFDSIDEKCSKSKSSRHSRRWPLTIFFRVLDISVLAMQLVEDHMKRRITMMNITREIRTMIRRILRVPEEQPTNDETNLILQKRKICHIYSSNKRRMTKYLCVYCKNPVCLGCTDPICKNCISNL
ncbi:uncharacterized protein LOC128854987 [Anastrepha ludens]|uniref:uncharacterized protein LOC128854987 n=1 Tax=Anastrepha ludens TaxID=28586 RepID=UPI0023B05347|nr:uncharacterized protein LOC128854987 [Anastrepha ludens]